MRAELHRYSNVSVFYLVQEEFMFNLTTTVELAFNVLSQVVHY